MKKYTLYILFLFVGSLFAQNEGIFKQANSLYNQEKYTEAIQEYQRILDDGQHSASLLL